MPRLKVFTTQSGFWELAVAAASQAKALEVWGIHQNLFAQGTARVATDKAAVAAATARPGVVLRRAIGGKGAFEDDPAPPKVRGRAKSRVPRADHAVRKAAQEARDAREALDRAEADHAEAIETLKREQEELDAKRDAEEKAWNARRKSLEAKGNRAKRALRE